MLKWNYKEVISALIPSPQPPIMLFRSIKRIKVQTSGADKTALPQKSSHGWNLRAEGFSEPQKVAEIHEKKSYSVVY